MFSSLLTTRLAGIKTGSSCQLEPAVAAAEVAGAGSQAVLVLAWSDLLDLFRRRSVYRFCGGMFTGCSGGGGLLMRGANMSVK